MATEYTGNLIPDMTSNTAPSGTVTYSNATTPTYDGFKAFDRNNSTFWSYNWSPPDNQWIAYEFDSSVQINKYTITCRADANDGSPNTWTFEGWTGSAWVELDSQSGITFTNGEKKEFTFTNSTAYVKYKIDITANNGRAFVQFAEMEMMTAFDNSGTTDSSTEYTGTDEFGSSTNIIDDANSPTVREFKSGNFVERSDGKILMTYSDFTAKKMYVSWVDTEADLYTTDAILTNETEIRSFTGEEILDTYSKNLSYLFKTSTGKLLLFTYDDGGDTAALPITVRVHESSNGLGTDFDSGTIIYQSDNLSGITSILSRRLFGLGIVQEIDGRLMLTAGGVDGPGTGIYAGSYFDTVEYIYSDDDGDNWSSSTVFSNFQNAYPTTYGNPVSGIAKCGTLLLINVAYGSSNYLNRMYYSPDNGDNWYDSETVSTTGDIIRGLLTSSDGYSYIIYYNGTTNKIYRRDYNSAIDLANVYTFGVGNEWDEVYRDTSIGDSSVREYMFESPSGNLIYSEEKSGVGAGIRFYTTDRTAVSGGITTTPIYQTTATIFICDFQGTTSAETGTVEGSITVSAHGLNADDFIVNTTQTNTSRRILSTTTDTMTVVSISGQTVSDEIRTYAFTDHTDLLKEQSLSVNKKIQEDTEARFTLICDPTYIPRAGQYVKINTNGQHVFTGFLRTVNRRLPQNGIDTKIFCDCECVTLNAIPPRRTLDIAYETGTTASDIVEALVNDFLVDEGVASGTIDQGVVLSDDWYDDSLSISDILDSLSDQSAFQWMIDKNFNLQFYQDPTTVSTYSATISDLTTSTFSDFRNVVISETIDNYNNKAFYVGNTDDYGNIIIVSQGTDASILETQDYAAGTGVYGTVVRDSNLTEHEFFTTTVGTTVDTIVATGIHDVVDVGDLVNNVDLDERRNVVSVSTDTLTLASAISGQTVGQTIATYQQINDIVDNHLKRQDQIPRRLEFDTFTTDFEAGQKLEVVLSKLSATTTESYVIDEVSIQDRGAGYFVAHITADKRNADNFSTQRTPNYKDYYRQF